ncbi:MAG: universal stress protein [Aquamicrobium sp.]|uniref:universal stress protein n=1 Tax=Aquamicrobium sp. TaxID=1872579 RepID=UPI00349EDE77|nr:universal stress protein [Aquamicrobium sp.]
MAATLLCCVNASAHARRAIELATEIAKALDHPLVFLLVNQTRPASGYPDIRAMSEKEARDILDIAMRYAEANGVKDARPALVEARDVAEAILDFAEERKAGHIVVGTGNPPFIGRLLLGSVSQTVVAEAKCSVTVAR